MFRTKRSKSLITVAALCAAAMALAGCGSASNAVGKDGKPKLTVMVVATTTTSPMNEMTWAKELAKDCGCDIEWQQVNDTAWDRQKNASLAAGSIPDVTIRGFSPSDALKNSSAFEDLSDDLDKLPNVQAFFKAKPLAEKLVNLDGKIWTLPMSRGKGFLASGQHLMINKQWLDKLGLEAPTTWDELTKVLEAFKTEDPNGNGKADEIPLNLRPMPTASMGEWWSGFLLLNSFGLVTSFNSEASRNGIYVKNGKVANWMQTDEFRKVIEYLHELTKEGLAPANWVTKPWDTYSAELRGDGKSTATVGAYFGWDPVNVAPIGSDLYNQYTTIPVPAAPGVDFKDTTWDASREATEFEDNHLSISATTPNKEAALKLTNLLYSEKYSVQQLYASITDGYVKDEGNHIYAIQQKFNDAKAARKSPGLYDRMAGWIPDNVTIKGDTTAESLQRADAPYAEQYKHYDHEKDALPMYVRLNSDEQVRYANLITSLMGTAVPTVANWLSKGGLNDKSWNEFQQDLSKLQIDQVTEIWQKAYDKYVK